MDRLKRISDLKNRSIPIEVASRNIVIALPPSDFIKQELEEREWTQAAFARTINMSPAYVNSLITNKTRINPQLALLLGKAFNQDPQIWMGLEMDYQKDLAKGKPELMEVEIRSQLYDLLPIDQMVERHMIKAGKSAYELLESVLRLLQLDKLDDAHIENKLAGAFRTTARPQNALTLLAWLNSARKKAGPKKTGRSFNRKAIEAEVDNFKYLTNEEDGPIKVINILWNNGVRVIHHANLKKISVDGAAFWIDEETPIVVLSFHLKRLDNFWFTLMHELGHILIDGFFTNYDYSEFRIGKGAGHIEEQANRFASDALIPPDLWAYIVKRCDTKYLSGRMLHGFASVADVHPAIIAGRLKKEGIVEWDHFNKGVFGETIDVDKVISTIDSLLKQRDKAI